jgi:hypothetical protein
VKKNCGKTHDSRFNFVRRRRLCTGRCAHDRFRDFWRYFICGLSKITKKLAPRFYPEAPLSLAISRYLTNAGILTLHYA